MYIIRKHVYYQKEKSKEKKIRKERAKHDGFCSPCKG